MRRIKEFIKKNYKIVLGVIIGFIASLVVVYATDTILFASNDVSYSNTESGLTSTTVKGAIDELYTKYTNLWCQSDYVKQNETSDSYECVVPPPPICTRVTSAADLHTETCSQSSNYCYADGYAATITYGTIWDGSSALKAGDAFDCDVNNNKVIDKDANGKSTERFYYVSDRWTPGTNINTFDSNTAVLIYYRNYISGAASDSGAAYATKAAATDLGYTCTSSNGCNWYGPLTKEQI